MEYANSVDFTKVLLVLSLLLFCCITDISTRRIPNAVLLPTLMTGLFLNALDNGGAGLVDSLGGLLVGIGMLMPLYVLGRMGAGDIKLLGVVGATLGTWSAVVAGLATMMAGGILGITYLAWLLAKPSIAQRVARVRRRLNWSSTAAGCNSTPMQSARATEIPYAIAIAAGTVAAMTYTGLFAEVIIT